MDYRQDVPGVFDEPGHFLRGNVTRRADQVAFILPIGIVHDDKKLSSLECIKGLFHVIENELVLCDEWLIGVHGGRVE